MISNWTSSVSRAMSRRLSLLAMVIVCATRLHAQGVEPIRITGSDSVEPIVEAAAGQFAKSHSNAKAAFDVKGTGQGFTTLCEGRADIAMASRPINTKELAACKGKNIAFVEIPMAWDGVVVVANRNDGWLRDITMAELKLLWGSESTQKAMKWSDIRSSYPATKVSLVGLDSKSGTRDFFGSAVAGNAASMRADYQQLTSHNEVIDAVAKSPGAIGFVSLSAYADHGAQTAALAVDMGGGPVLPTSQTIISDQYAKLSRLLFIYVSKQSYDQKPATREFADFLVSGGSRFVQFARLVPLTEKNYQENAAKLKRGEVGSKYLQ
jgi:phosphate transport system substrate-binding protein